MLKIMRGAVTEVTPGTLAEQAINTPIDLASRIAIIVKRIKGTLYAGAASLTRPAADALQMNVVDFAISTRNGLAAIPFWDNSGCIMAHRALLVENSAPADAGVGGGTTEWNFDQDFGEGIVLADQQISLYIQSATFSGVCYAKMAIYYDLKRLGANEFLAALTMHEAM